MRTFVKPVNHHNKNRENYWLKTLVQDYKCFKSMKRSFDFMCSFAENLTLPIKGLEREMYLNRSLSEEQMVKIYRELSLMRIIHTLWQQTVAQILTEETVSCMLIL